MPYSLERHPTFRGHCELGPAGGIRAAPGPALHFLERRFLDLGRGRGVDGDSPPSPRARLAIALYLSGYTLWWWADRLLLQAPRPNWPFALTATIVLLALAASLIFNRKTIADPTKRDP